jgi:hypothetical protein
MQLILNKKSGPRIMTACMKTKYGHKLEDMLLKKKHFLFIIWIILNHGGLNVSTK